MYTLCEEDKSAEMENLISFLYVCINILFSVSFGTHTFLNKYFALLAKADLSNQSNLEPTHEAENKNDEHLYANRLSSTNNENCYFFSLLRHISEMPFLSRPYRNSMNEGIDEHDFLSIVESAVGLSACKQYSSQ
jgi:hypothetical protein